MKKPFATLQKLLLAVVLFFSLSLNKSAHSQDNSQNGPKTKMMLDSLKEDGLEEYDPTTETIKHQGVSFSIVKGSTFFFSKMPLVCISSFPCAREIICLTPSSLLLRKSFDHLKTKLTASSSLPDLLNALARFIRNDIFSLPLCNELHLNSFIHQWYREEGRTFQDFARTRSGCWIPMIALDDFMAAKVGVCRHLSLLSCYFLDRLLGECVLPKGRCHHVRDMVQTIEGAFGHAWSLLVLEEDRGFWHIDSMWGIVKNLDDEEDLQFLKMVYGEEVIEREIARFRWKHYLPVPAES
ncbi:MAG: hypothetical protein ACM3JI_03820 [Anaerolineae bacterium]